MCGEQFDRIENQLSQIESQLPRIENQLSQVTDGMATLQARLDRFEITMLEAIDLEFNSFRVPSNRGSSRIRKS